jgi:hypothetical protein
MACLNLAVLESNCWICCAQWHFYVIKVFFVCIFWLRTHNVRLLLQVPQTLDAELALSTSSDSDEGSSSFVKHPDINDLKWRIDAAITRLGGRVVPKLNWSAPTDATWVSPSGLSCSNADEVLLLLKSSERISHDMDTISDLNCGLCESLHCPHVIVLKKFFQLRRDREFRCFVRANELIAICQRDPTQYHSDVVPQKEHMLALIEAFFASAVCRRFPLPECALPLPLRAVS